MPETESKSFYVKHMKQKSTSLWVLEQEQKQSNVQKVVGRFDLKSSTCFLKTHGFTF